MKKFFLFVAISGLFLSEHSIVLATAKPIQAIDKQTLAQMSDTEKEATLLSVKERLLEIKSLDQSQLSKTERQAIRLEKKNAKAIAAGLDRKVSISIGAIVIAVLLLLLIF